MNNIKWIVLSFVLGCILCGLLGCKTDQKVKVVTDINQQGEVTWHTEYNVEW